MNSYLKIIFDGMVEWLEFQGHFKDKLLNKNKQNNNRAIKINEKIISS